jgi:hypothetical protein
MEPFMSEFDLSLINQVNSIFITKDINDMRQWINN